MMSKTETMSSPEVIGFKKYFRCIYDVSKVKGELVYFPGCERFKQFYEKDAFLMLHINYCPYCGKKILFYNMTLRDN